MHFNAAFLMFFFYFLCKICQFCHQAVAIASFMMRTNSAIFAGLFSPYPAQRRTIGDPTMTPSALFAISFACSGPEIPKPIAHGTSLTCFAVLIIAPTSVVIRLLVPVTPSEDTQYKNPVASAAIILILSWEDMKDQMLSFWLLLELLLTGLLTALWNGREMVWFPGLFLLVVGKLSGERIGLGDGWLLLALGMWLPYEILMGILFLGLLAGAGYGILSGKKEIPLVPFFTVGFVLTVWGTII